MHLRRKLLDRARRYGKIASGLLLLGLVSFAAPYVWDALHDDEMLVTISPETTFITEPLRPDGYVDYQAGLRQQAAHGVTPENNAAVMLFEVCGLDDLSLEFRERYCRELGIAPLQEDGQYLRTWLEEISDDSQKLRALAEAHIRAVPQSELKFAPDEAPAYIEAERAHHNSRLAWNLAEWAQTAPWTDAEVPYGAEWITKHESPMQKFIEGSLRPKYFAPLSATKEDAASTSLLLPDVDALNKCLESLHFYALGTWGQGKTKEATDALIAGLRWSRLASHGSTFVHWYASRRAEFEALTMLVMLSASERLSAAEIRKLQNEIARLRPAFSFVTLIDQRERLFVLSDICLAARRGISTVRPASQDSLSWFEKLHSRRERRRTDWDGVLRTINAIFDLKVRITQEKDPKARRNLIAEMEAMDNRFEKDQVAGFWTLLKETASPQEARRRQTEAAAALYFTNLWHEVWNAEDERNTQLQLAQVALQLCLYRVEKGQFPTDLAALVPAYWPELPVDAFNPPLPLRYQREQDGFLLYSVGPNRADDAGRGMLDNPTGDDVAIRSKPPALTAP